MRIVFLFTLALSVSSTQALQMKCYGDRNIEDGHEPEICGIYLHGLHPANDVGSYTRYEAKNRPVVKAFAKDLQKRLPGCLIAAPVSEASSTRLGRMLNWQHHTLKEVEDAAKQACHAQLADKRVLVGFSAGGWEALSLARGNCKALTHYTQIVAIGVPESKQNPRSDHTMAGMCKQLRVYKTHDFLGQFTEDVQEDVMTSLNNDGGPSSPEQLKHMAEGQPSVVREL